MADIGTELFSSWNRGQEKMNSVVFTAAMAAGTAAMYYGAGAAGAAEGMQGIVAISGPVVGATIVPMAVDKAVQMYDKLTAKSAVNKFVKTHPAFRGKEEELLEIHKETLQKEPRYRGLLTMMEMERDSKVQYAGNDMEVIRQCCYHIRNVEPFRENVAQKVVETMQHGNQKFHQSFLVKGNTKETAKSKDIGSAVTEVCKGVFSKELTGMYSPALAAEAYIGDKKVNMSDLTRREVDIKKITVKDGLVLPEGMDSISFSTYKGDDLSTMYNVTLKPVKETPGLFRMQEVVVDYGIDYDHNSSVKEYNRLVCLDGKKVAKAAGIAQDKITQKEQDRGKAFSMPAKDKTVIKIRDSVRQTKENMLDKGSR